MFSLLSVHPSIFATDLNFLAWVCWIYLIFGLKHYQGEFCCTWTNYNYPGIDSWGGNSRYYIIIWKRQMFFFKFVLGKKFSLHFNTWSAPFPHQWSYYIWWIKHQNLYHMLYQPEGWYWWRVDTVDTYLIILKHIKKGIWKRACVTGYTIQVSIGYLNQIFKTEIKCTKYMIVYIFVFSR